MANAKRRPFQHVMEEDSIDLLKANLPPHWVVRQYKPDYGIDLVVEVFDVVDEARGMSETLGEHFFIQLKSVQSTKFHEIIVKPRLNVELYPLGAETAAVDMDQPWIETAGRASTDQASIQVVKHQLETSELVTIQSMGSGAVVLLVVACLDLKRTFFVCLNDYIDKVLLPEDARYASQGSKVINIPVSNEFERTPRGNTALRFLAKRAKLYSAFQKFNFQYGTLQYFGNAPAAILRQSLSVFTEVIKRQQIWSDMEMWGIIGFYRARLEGFEELLADPAIDKACLYIEALDLWRCLSLLSRNFEEICREWHLPTYFSFALASPTTAISTANSADVSAQHQDAAVGPLSADSSQ